MLKKMMMIVMAFTLLIAFTSPDSADARRGGGFKSGPRTYSPTPKKATTNNYKKSDTTTNNKMSGTTNGMNSNRGFFSGGSFMKGLMVGGLAGMLFGGVFGNMGFLGNMLGMAVNLLAIYFIIMIVVSLFQRFRKKPQHPGGPDDYDRGGRY
ncbi:MULTISPECIES: hypothetical protein [unclassified Paenibacillus]|uniref:hypothetical protein n=1 Tax=unclassified Paenibacillus TaxID=185978 RepID=UPI000839B54F|nr:MULTISPECIES: hypothetical protein [unclassified Paenibacillus]NWL86889.1 hypothetical protein [Paenibacillus sp. 79R4]